jgi:hypothetical protein
LPTDITGGDDVNPPAHAQITVARSALRRFK